MYKRQIKTLLIEFGRHLKKDNPTLRIVSGQMPKAEQLEKMPGRELYDPWSNNPYKPRYVDQVDQWKNQNFANEARENSPI